MNSTFHKCVLNVNAGPNPTPMSKLGEQNQKTRKSMKSTFRKCVLNVNAGPNPTPMSKLGKLRKANTDPAPRKGIF